MELGFPLMKHQQSSGISTEPVVHLNRRKGGVEGIYHCKIPDSGNVIQTVYIGVYTASTSTGEWHYMYTLMSHWSNTGIGLCILYIMSKWLWNNNKSFFYTANNTQVSSGSTQGMLSRLTNPEFKFRALFATASKFTNLKVLKMSVSIMVWCCRSCNLFCV